MIARRHLPGDASDDVPAALPLPPDHGKGRLAFSLPSNADLLVLAPVSPRDAARTAPEAWRTVKAGLVPLDEVIEAMPRAHGASLWQHVTGLPCLTRSSDLDLLWSGGGEVAVRTLVAGPLRLDVDSAVRIDGEVELPDKSARNWCELADERAAGTVLLKTMNGTGSRTVVETFQRDALS